MQSKGRFVLVILSILLVSLSLISAGIGALRIEFSELISIITDQFRASPVENYEPLKATVFWSIRVPRILTAILIGAALSVSGVCLQGLFRNPLADPGLIGISSGASLSASIVIVLGLNVGFLGQYFLSLMAFLGAAFVALIVYNISRVAGKTLVATMLLAGVAFTALSEAGRGFLTLISSESELRDMTFWLLGSLGSATWNSILGLLPFIIIPLFFILQLGKQLNAFALGENDAGYMGVNIKRLKFQIILLTTIMVGASVAVSGMIGFLGLIIPHLMRLIVGPDHRILLFSSLLAGALLLVLSDLLCRTVLAPIEIPIGVITAALGTPLFLSILIREKKKQITI